MDNITIARHIKKEWNNFMFLVEENKEECWHPENFLEKAGYKVTSTGFGGWYAEKNGLQFCIGRYSSCYTLHCDRGFYVGGSGLEHGPYFRIFEVDKRIEDILAAGYVLPEDHYVRSVEVEVAIANIKAEIEKAKALIPGGYGERGDKLYRNGYHVGYDGGSVCDFSKGAIHFHAHNDYPGGWKLEDRYQVYLADDIPSIDFSVYTDRYLQLDRDYEAILGDRTTFGRQLTEKDKIGSYTKFRVRSYVPRELETLEWFDNFEDAKKFAYETAKRYAEGVKDDRRRYAHTNPMDVSDRFDYLAAYVWYVYDRGSEHMVFVQGENE